MAELSRQNMVEYYRAIRKAKGSLEKRMEALLQRQRIAMRHGGNQDTLEVNGVPGREGENLKAVMGTLFLVLSCYAVEEDIVYIYRTRLRQPRPIVAKLRSRELRDHIVSAATRYNKVHVSEKLNCSHIGFNEMKMPVLVSPLPSRLNKIHRQVVRTYLYGLTHHDSSPSTPEPDSAPAAQDPRFMVDSPASPSPPPLLPEIEGPESPIVRPLRDLCAIIIEQGNAEPKMAG